VSWGANEWARKTRVGDSKLKLVLMMLSNYANEAGECWHSQERISYDTEIPVRTLRRKLEDLVALGLIEVVPRVRADGTKASSLIRLLATPPAAKMAGGGRPETPRDTSDDAVPPACGQNVQRPKMGVTSGQKGGSPAATWMAEQESSGITNESSKEITRARASAFFDERFWPAYPKRLGGNPKEDARKKFVAAVVSGENPEEILAGLGRLVHEMQAVNKLGTEFVPTAVVWLNKKRWKDDPPPDGEGLPPNRPNDRGPQPSFFGLANELGKHGR
jgi:hypothetical protein